MTSETLKPCLRCGFPIELTGGTLIVDGPHANDAHPYRPWGWKCTNLAHEGGCGIMSHRGWERREDAIADANRRPAAPPPAEGAVNVSKLLSRLEAEASLWRVVVAGGGARSMNKQSAVSVVEAMETAIKAIQLLGGGHSDTTDREQGQEAMDAMESVFHECGLRHPAPPGPGYDFITMGDMVVRRLRASQPVAEGVVADPKATDVWQCQGCGEVFRADQDGFHVEAVPGRDGGPEPYQCGPVVRLNVPDVSAPAPEGGTLPPGCPEVYAYCPESNALTAPHNAGPCCYPVEIHPKGTRSSLRAADLGRGELEAVTAERDRLLALINTPELADFTKAVQLEAVHQRERWGTEGDAGKTPEDWMWLVAYLSTKATQASRYGDRDKYLHHIITAAAALLNWHANAAGTNTAMQPSAEEVVALVDGPALPSAPQLKGGE